MCQTPCWWLEHPSELNPVSVYPCACGSSGGTDTYLNEMQISLLQPGCRGPGMKPTFKRRVAGRSDKSQ